MTEYQFKILENYYYIVQNLVKHWNFTVQDTHPTLDGNELHDRLLFRMINAIDNLEKNNITDEQHIKNYLSKCLKFEILNLFRDTYKLRGLETPLTAIDANNEEIGDNLIDFVYWKDHIGDTEDMAIINTFLQEIKETFCDEKKIIEMLIDGASIEDISEYTNCPKSKIYSLRKSIRRYYESNFGVI